jgi:hypothetical protein
MYVTRVSSTDTDSPGVQPVGNIETYPGYATTTTTGASPPTTTAWWGTRVAWDDLPVATNLTSWIPIVTPTTAPLANNTRLDCDEYTDNTLGPVPCHWIALGVDIADFASWNPSVDVYNCSLANNTRYCTLLGSGYDISNLTVDPNLYYAEVPPDAAVNSTHECYAWYYTSKGLFCLTLFWCQARAHTVLANLQQPHVKIFYHMRISL